MAEKPSALKRIHGGESGSSSKRRCTAVQESGEQAEDSQHSKRNRPTRRGRRSPEKQAKRLEKYVKSGGSERAHKVIAQLTHTYHAPQYPYEFVKVRKSCAFVRETIHNEYPDASHPENYPSLPANVHDILVVHTPPKELAADPTHPPYLMLRCDSIFSPKKQAKILAAWDRVQKTSPAHYISRENRSKTPGYHWGIWEASAAKPFVTRESREQTPEAIKAIDGLLGLLGILIVPKMVQITKEYLPNQWVNQERSYTRVKAWLGRELSLRPALDFHGAFFTIAVKEGCSEIVHIDWADAKKSVTWVFAVGDWEGAEFVAPQLFIRVPVLPGHLFGVMAGTIAHFTTPIRSGRRIIFTCFTDQLIATHTNLPTTLIG